MTDNDDVLKLIIDNIKDQEKHGVDSEKVSFLLIKLSLPWNGFLFFYTLKEKIFSEDAYN